MPHPKASRHFLPCNSFFCITGLFKTMAEKEEDEVEDCCSGLLDALASAAAACAGICWAPEDKHVGKYRYCLV